MVLPPGFKPCGLEAGPEAGPGALLTLTIIVNSSTGIMEWWNDA